MALISCMQLLGRQSQAAAMLLVPACKQLFVCLEISDGRALRVSCTRLAPTEAGRRPDNRRAPVEHPQSTRKTGLPS